MSQKGSGSQLLAQYIAAELPRIKVGALRIWGEWFGRPYDNCHRICGAVAADEKITIRFNEDEVLTVWSPSEWSIGENVFEIGTADRVRWEWYLYGRPKVDANRHFMDFMRSDSIIQVSHNINWGPTRQFDPQPSAAAAEIL